MGRVEKALGIGVLSLCAAALAYRGKLGQQLPHLDQKVRSIGQFLLKDGQLAGPLGAGIYGGFATTLSYKYSPMAAKAFEDHARNKGNIEQALVVRITSINVANLVLVFLGSKFITKKFSNHQVTLLGSLSYAYISNTFSGVATINTSEKAMGFGHKGPCSKDNNDFYELHKKWLSEPKYNASKKIEKICLLGQMIVKGTPFFDPPLKLTSIDAFARHTDKDRVLWKDSFITGIFAGVQTGIVSFALYLGVRTTTHVFRLYFPQAPKP